MFSRRQFFYLAGGLGCLTLTTLATNNLRSKATPTELKSLVKRPSVAPPGWEVPAYRGDVRMLVISDLNSAYGSTDYRDEVKRAIELIPQWQPDLVLCGGDMVAGQKRELTWEQIKAMWDAFDQYITAPIRSYNLPFGFTVGNHDASSLIEFKREYIFQKDRDLAASYWRDPKHDPGVKFVVKGDFPFSYSFMYEDLYFLVCDASSHRLSPKQITWIRNNLASPVAQRAKMRIVLGHLPLFAVAEGRNKFGDILVDRDQLLTILEQYHVHTYISGHHHAYFPGHYGNIELLFAGVLGDGERPLLSGDSPKHHTITIIDVDLANLKTYYTTYDVNTTQVIKLESLPEEVIGFNGSVLRRDIFR